MPASEGSPRSPRQPVSAAAGATLAGESGGKPGDRASMSGGWRIFDFIATHLQVHLAAAFLISGSGWPGGFPISDNACRPTNARRSHDVRDRNPPPPAPDLQPPGVVQSCRAI